MTNTTTQTPPRQKQEVVSQSVHEQNSSPVGTLALLAAGILGGAALLLLTGEDQAPTETPEPESTTSPLDADELPTLTEDENDLLRQVKHALQMIYLQWWLCSLNSEYSPLRTDKEWAAENTLSEKAWRMADATRYPNLRPYINDVLIEANTWTAKARALLDVSAGVCGYDINEQNGLKATLFGWAGCPPISFDAHSHYDKREYFEAADCFAKAYLERPHASFLWNIGKCWAKMGYTHGEPEFFYKAAEQHVEKALGPRKAVSVGTAVTPPPQPVEASLHMSPTEWAEYERLAKLGICFREVTKKPDMLASPEKQIYGITFTFNTRQPNNHLYHIVVQETGEDARLGKYRLANAGQKFNTKNELAKWIYKNYLQDNTISPVYQVATKYANLDEPQRQIFAQVLATRVFIEMGWKD